MRLYQIRLAIAFGLLFGCTFWGVACAPLPRRIAPEPSPTPALSAADIDLDALIAAHNRERAEAKLPPLKSNDLLRAAAEVHARDMAKHSKMSHTGSDDSTFSERIDRQGYRYRAAGENVAYGQRTVAEVMTGWMNSPHHKENILGNFSEIGVAVVRDKKGANYWCADFGTPWPKLEPATATRNALDGINAARVDAKLPRLTSGPILAEEADRHAHEKADQKPPEKGVTPLGRVIERTKRYRSLIQSDAYGPALPEDAVKVWLDGKDTKASLLGDFDEAGLGYATDKEGKPYWCLILGRTADHE